jgi:hypothetical protein
MIGGKVRLGGQKRSLRAQPFLFLAALMAMMPAGTSEASACLYVERNGLRWRSIPAVRGSKARLSFHHSIYGSRVEEVFRIGADAFHLTELRYAERRLVEFYGYEGAVYESGSWVVRPRPAAVRSLSLRTSSVTSLSLVLDHGSKSVELAMPPDSALHLTIAACKDAQNG